MDISVTRQVITVDETEVDGTCRCECLFDVDLEVHDLAPGRYTIQVLERLTGPDQIPLVFSVELDEPLAGRFCVERTHYPWGVGQ